MVECFRKAQYESKKIMTDTSTVVMGVIGADCHAVANKLIELTLREADFRVVNLGVMVSPEEFIAAAIETHASAILISSLYGHGEMDCQGFRERCIEAGIGDILLYIGGNLVVGKQDFSEVERRFKAMGFDRVFAPGTPPEAGVALLKEDLAARRVRA